MFKFIKFLLITVTIFGAAYFVFMVPLGEKTFWGHMSRIKETEEAKELEAELEKKVKGAADGVTNHIKQKAADIAKHEGRSLLSGNSNDSSGSGAKPAEAGPLGEEKQELDKLIRTVAEPDQEDKEALSRLISKKNDQAD